MTVSLQNDPRTLALLEVPGAVTGLARIYHGLSITPDYASFNCTWSSGGESLSRVGKDVYASAVQKLTVIGNATALDGTFDFTNCSALTEVDMPSTGLIGMVVANCASLLQLDCASNSLTTLNVNGCTGLQYLNFSHNSITYINIKSCVALTNLVCDHNLLSVAQIDAILAALVAAGLSTGTATLNGQTPAAPPSTAGAANVVTLTARGWTVTTD
jgi:Leucine-rich repeat (LRR) protein